MKIRLKLMRETCIMAGLCLFDLLLTLWLLRAGMATEANPLMLTVLNAGLLWFIAFKCAYTFGPLALLEMVGRKYPHIVRKYMRLGITLYVGFHGVNLACAWLAPHLTQRG